MTNRQSTDRSQSQSGPETSQQKATPGSYEDHDQKNKQEEPTIIEGGSSED